MEKLQQVQKYQFWILLFVALVLPLVGWFMSRSGLMAEAADRTLVLQNLTTSLKAGPEDPNGEWQRKLDEINVEQQKQALIAWRALFDRQKPFMVWPQDMVDDPAKIEPFHQEIYRERYVDELEKVHQIINPADEKWKTGLVKFPEDLLPHPHDEWKLQAPSAKQIEAAQEDLWLLTALLNCIASVNEGSTTPFDAPIREITELHLRGGTKGGGGSAPPAPGKPPGGGQGGMPPGGMPPGGMPPGGMPPGVNRPAGGDTGSTGIASPSIKADEVLGPERPANDANAPAPAAPQPGPGGQKGPPGPGGPPGAPPGDAAKPRGSVTGVDRYRDDQPEFKTRGFTLQLVMDLRSVPALLVALSNCEGWPVNILRVHEADYKDEDLVVVDAGGGDAAPRPPAGGVRPPAGFGPPPRGGIGPRPGEEADNGPAGSRSPLDDPNLARVAIVGLMYIFKTPPEAPAAPETPAAPAAAPVAGEPATPAAAADSAPSGGDEPESEPAATDKPEATTDKDDSEEKGADAPSDSSSDPATEAPESKSKPKPAPKAKAGEP